MMHRVDETERLTLPADTTTALGGYPYPTESDRRRARLDAVDQVLHLVRGNTETFDAREIVVLAEYVATGTLLDFTPAALHGAAAAMRDDG